LTSLFEAGVAQR